MTNRYIVNTFGWKNCATMYMWLERSVIWSSPINYSDCTKWRKTRLRSLWHTRCGPMGCVQCHFIIISNALPRHVVLNRSYILPFIVFNLFYFILSISFTPSHPISTYSQSESHTHRLLRILNWIFQNESNSLQFKLMADNTRKRPQSCVNCDMVTDRFKCHTILWLAFILTLFNCYDLDMLLLRPGFPMTHIMWIGKLYVEKTRVFGSPVTNGWLNQINYIIIYINSVEKVEEKKQNTHLHIRTNTMKCDGAFVKWVILCVAFCMPCGCIREFGIFRARIFRRI